jgi:DnaJ-class molecular chaperone
MKVKDYYKILGVERTASAQDIKKAYYKLIWKYHPDKSNNNDYYLEKFLEITEAYNVLGNLDNRLRYSIMLHSEILDKELLHKNFNFPGMMDKKKRK